MKRAISILLSFILVLGICVISTLEPKAAPSYEFSGEAHVQSYGDKAGTFDGKTLTLGTSGKAKRLEAIKIKLTGEISNYYDVYYRVHAQSIGWMNWAKNGEMAGTSNGSKRLEAIQIVLVKKTENAPSGYYDGIASVSNSAYLVLSKESGASHVHKNVYRERISKQYLVIDPYIDTEYLFNGYYKNDISGSCFYHDDMPDCYQGWSNGGLPEYEGIIIMGNMIDATHFKVDSENYGTGRDKWSQFVHNGIVDVSTLDWYCLHDGKQSWYECAICGKQDMTLYSNGPYMNFSELGEHTSKNTCHCEEFIRKQYGILYLRPIIEQWREGNGVYTKFGNAKIEYNRCKHPHFDDLDIGKSCGGFYYKKCSTCGAIFKK